MPRGEDVFVRLESGFILEDPRYLRHGLVARAVFHHLSAIAVRQRQEFLPARYSPDLLAISMRCTAEEVGAGLDELVGAVHEPLVGRLADGRIRVIDVRKCHGKKFRWLDQTEEFAAWAAEHGEAGANADDCPRTGTYGDERGQQSPTAPEVRGKRLDVDVQRQDERARRSQRGRRDEENSGPTRAERDTATPDGVVAEDWRRLMGMTSAWPDAGKTRGRQRLAAILRANGPKDAEAWVRKAARGWKRGELDVGPWAVLAKGWGPSERDRGGGEQDTTGRGGDVATLGDVLVGGA